MGVRLLRRSYSLMTSCSYSSSSRRKTGKRQSIDTNRCLSAVSIGDSAIVLKSVMEEIFGGEDGFSTGSSLVIGCFVTWRSYIGFGIAIPWRSQSCACGDGRMRFGQVETVKCLLNGDSREQRRRFCTSEVWLGAGRKKLRVVKQGVKAVYKFIL